MSVQQSSVNAIPSILMTNANNENQSIRVESVLLDADTHTWNAESFGKTRFVLPKKASVLSNDGVLIWKTTWSSYNTANNASYTYPRDGGCVSALKKCSLYLDGKLLSETDELGSRLWYKNKFMPYDAQTEILDVHTGGNHLYGHLADGSIKLAEDNKMNTRGCREIVANRLNNLETSIPLKQLFPMLQDTLIPTAIRGDLVVEIEWEGQPANVMVEGGDGFVGNVARRLGYEVIQPRLALDYIQYAPDVESALKEQINSQQGMMIPYREAHLVRAVIPANGTGANIQQQVDIELGFQNRSVMKIYVQKLQVGAPSALTRNCRSDGQLQEEIQLVINNKTMYDRNVKLFSEMYSYLNQTGESPYNALPSTLERVGISASADYNMFNDTVGLPSNVANPAPNSQVLGVQSNLQGRGRLLGFNLAQGKGGQDTPSNSILVGESPIVLRISRNNTSACANEPDQNPATAVNLNIWVEAVRSMVISNGRVEILSI
tara:strand:- start:4384 stop:5856 length:1473 start_codon:yes stop_codon:yes gene_type:complete